MTSSISLASNGLILLGADSISSFEDGSTGAVIASALYQSTFEAMLTTYTWRFASKKAQLARLSAAPLNDYQYQYQLPSDLLYLQKPITTRDYEIYEDKMFSDATVEEVDYTFKVNESKLPPYFVKSLEFLLASQFAISVTSDKELAKLYYGMYQDQLSKAKFADSSQRPTEVDEFNEYVAIRHT